MKKIAVLLLSAAMVFPALADTCRAPKPFFVSMLLGKIDAPTVVRLVHAQQLACTSADAEVNLGREVAKEFSGYKILDTITMPVNQAASEPKRAGRGIYTDV